MLILRYRVDPNIQELLSTYTEDLHLSVKLLDPLKLKVTRRDSTKVDCVAVIEELRDGRFILNNVYYAWNARGKPRFDIVLPEKWVERRKEHKHDQTWNTTGTYIRPRIWLLVELTCKNLPKYARPLYPFCRFKCHRFYEEIASHTYFFKQSYNAKIGILALHVSSWTLMQPHRLVSCIYNNVYMWCLLYFRKYDVRIAPCFDSVVEQYCDAEVREIVDHFRSAIHRRYVSKAIIKL